MPSEVSSVLTKLTAKLLISSVFIMLSSALALAAERHDLRSDQGLLKRLQNANAASFQATLGLSGYENLKLVRVRTDSRGLSHSRYQQTTFRVSADGRDSLIDRFLHILEGFGVFRVDVLKHSFRD